METRDKDNGTREFVGYVTEMGGGLFTSILRDVRDPERKYVSTFDVEKDVQDEDVPLVDIGAAFHLIISEGNPNRRILRFNRPSSLSSGYVEMIKDTAERLDRNINWR